jgi:argininosuccinate lyase
MKMWDGRFANKTHELMEAFNNSLSFDIALLEQDIAGNIAWAKALEKCDVLSAAEAKLIITGLRELLEEYRQGALRLLPGDEDVHMAIERLLIDKIGDAGARLHTGRSRNDQVATDFRLFVKDALDQIAVAVTGMQKILLSLAEQHQRTIIPGFTHLQQAQPVLLAHYWLSFFWALQREKNRLANAKTAADILPLGSGALAGAGFAVDREYLARELGFSAISDNSIDAVGSRDFALEALSAIASLGVLCSRYAEDLIIWSSREFGFIELDDAWSTGSSMMPQKKNPDSLELIRGKCGRFIGNHNRLAVTLKGCGLTYYKDLQEDKEPFFDSIAHIIPVVTVFTNVLATLTINEQRISADLDPFLLATDLADYLVEKKVPFRQAHKIVGKIVGHCVEKKIPLDKLSVSDLASFSDVFKDDVMQIFSWEHAISHRDIRGGTGPKSVAQQIEQARKLVG